MEYPLKDLSYIACSYATCVVSSLFPHAEFCFPLVQEKTFTLSFRIPKGSIEQSQFPDIENEIRRLWKEHPDFQNHLTTAKNARNLFISQNQLIWADSTPPEPNALFYLMRINNYYQPCPKEQLSPAKDLFIRPIFLQKAPQGHRLLTCVFGEDKQELKQNYKLWQQSSQKTPFANQFLEPTPVIEDSFSLALNDLAAKLKTLAKEQGFSLLTCLTEKTLNLEEATKLLLGRSLAFTVVNIFSSWELGANLSCKNPRVSPLDLWVETCTSKNSEQQLKYYLQFIEAKCKILGQKAQVVLALPQTKLHAETLRKNAQLLKKWTEQRDCGRVVFHTEKFVRLSWFTQDVFGERWETAFIDLLSLDKKGVKSNDALAIRFSLCGPHLRFLEVIAELTKEIQTSISF